MADHAALTEQIRHLIERSSESDGAYVQAADLIGESAVASLPEVRLAILRSFTIEPLVEVLKVMGFLEGWSVQLFVSEFNQSQQEIVDPSSRLYQFKPDVTFVAVRLEELCPPLIQAYARLTLEERAGYQAEVLQTLASWIECLERHGAGHVLVSNFLVPPEGAQGLYDTQTADGQVAIIRALNAGLVALRERFPQLHVFDLELLAGSVGKTKFLDPVQWYRMANPYRLSAYPAYGKYVLRHLKALLGRGRKCLVLDLDDTLWGGAIGEDGMTGVALSDTYPGNCFKEFQQALLQLFHRGILLAVNSKNNYDEGIAMIRSHPHMILREAHFSAVRINWNDKAENLVAIARELNLGLEALVVMDDSAVECARMREAYPEVLVIQLPSQPSGYCTLLDGLECFDQLTITAEDRARGQFYREQTKRHELAAQASTLEEFYASLQMRGTLYRNEPSQVPRIAQMTQKTNQFNLTTKRYTESQIAHAMQTGIVYSLQIEDRFGDNGVVAAAIVIPTEDGSEWVIENLLMSCRVLMRTIEDTLLAHIAEDGAAKGVPRLVGRYVPSGRNQIVKDFYRARGFASRACEGDGAHVYVFDVSRGSELRSSAWIRLTQEAALPR